MAAPPARPAPTVIPTLRYAEAAAAIRWLQTAFGFTTVFTVPGEDGSIVHAELVLGDAMIMLGTMREDIFRSRLPRQAGGVTQAAYIVVEDVDALHARAVAAGAESIMAPYDTDHGSRSATLADPVGHVWHFGTYRPSLDGWQGG
jgi:uncharacterized glyoxalase superfamily protein PhnB